MAETEGITRPNLDLSKLKSKNIIEDENQDSFTKKILSPDTQRRKAHLLKRHRMYSSCTEFHSSKVAAAAAKVNAEQKNPKTVSPD